MFETGLNFLVNRSSPAIARAPKTSLVSPLRPDLDFLNADAWR